MYLINEVRSCVISMHTWEVAISKDFGRNSKLQHSLIPFLCAINIS